MIGGFGVKAEGKGVGRKKGTSRKGARVPKGVKV